MENNLNKDYNDCHHIEFLNFRDINNHIKTVVKIYSDYNGFDLKAFVDIENIDPNNLIFIDNFCKAYKEYFNRLKSFAVKESILTDNFLGDSFNSKECFLQLVNWLSKLNDENRLYIQLYDDEN